MWKDAWDTTPDAQLLPVCSDTGLTGRPFNIYFILQQLYLLYHEYFTDKLIFKELLLVTFPIATLDPEQLHTDILMTSHPSCTTVLNRNNLVNTILVGR